MYLNLSCDVDDTTAEESNDEVDNNAAKRSSYWFSMVFTFASFTKFSLRMNSGGDFECLTSRDIKKIRKMLADLLREKSCYK